MNIDALREELRKLETNELVINDNEYDTIKEYRKIYKEKLAEQETRKFFLKKKIKELQRSNRISKLIIDNFNSAYVTHNGMIGLKLLSEFSKKKEIYCYNNGIIYGELEDGSAYINISVYDIESNVDIYNMINDIPPVFKIYEELSNKLLENKEKINYYYERRDTDVLE